MLLGPLESQALPERTEMTDKTETLELLEIRAIEEPQVNLDSSEHLGTTGTTVRMEQ